jgi:hypothetical protein
MLTVLFGGLNQTYDIHVPINSFKLDGGDSEALSQGSRLEYFMFKK